MERQDQRGKSSPATDVNGEAPWSHHDPYTDEALLDPWPGYKQLRDAGPAAWLPKYEMFALTRYASVRRALEDWESFPSRACLLMIWGVGGDDRAYDACGSDFG